MSSSSRARRRRPPRTGRALTAWLLVAALAMGGCGWSRRGALDPAGPGARHLNDLFAIALWTSIGVTVLTLGLLAFALWRRRADDEPEHGGDREHAPWGSGTRFVAVLGLGMPIVVLMGMMAVTFWYLAGVETDGQLQVTVDGHQYWWEVNYPERGVTTANEIHVPTGVDVELQLTTDDVIHSFWVPELGGKADLVPGRVNDLVVHADEPGVYRGQCAEYCGLQHANMAFLVIAHEPDDFEAWLDNEAGPAAVRDGAGLAAFERNACAACHTIRGTSADGEVGPDLTHLANRRTIGAGTLANDRGNLAAWVVNAQTIKPGSLMPPITTLQEEELEALLDFLERLE